MEDAQKQLVDKLKSANNILVTVSRDPSVDQLSALLGMTLLLNKAGKHAAAVFSGNVPSTLEFLKPDETIEKNTDSLRDFIIALDKNKADKLRYKVEDNVVRIFITPFRTSITEDDFEFSQGDFNVDLVVALGVREQSELDEAIVAHGRILHDATVASVNVAPDGGLGTINWHNPDASSLSEMVTQLGKAIDDKLFDEQISTALLTGVVAETDRFSNERTSSETMNVSARLMTAGANQQLVASKLQDAGELASIDLKQERAAELPAAEVTQAPVQSPDGSLAINHDALPETVASDLPTFELPTPDVESLPSEETQPLAMEEGFDQNLSPGAKLITEPPTLGGTLTANSVQEPYSPTTDPMSQPAAPQPQILEHSNVSAANQSVAVSPTSPAATTAPPLPPEPLPEVAAQMTPPPPAWTPPQEDPLNNGTDSYRTGQTLVELEEAVASPHLKTGDVGVARDEVSQALNADGITEAPQPKQSVGSQQLGPELRPSDLSSDPTLPAQAPPSDPNTPPPVPPPIPFQFGNPPPPQ